MPSPTAIQRLFRPRHIAVVGGERAASVVEQCRRNGFSGPLWAVHPQRDTLAGLPCFRTVGELPEPPDATFIAVPRETTIEIVAALSRIGAGGAVCHASGFAESGPEGEALQTRLLAAAGDMALLGPNCWGFLNLLDGAGLWPDPHGAVRAERGVAIVSQSGNMAISLSMQRRSLPIAYLITAGNQASVQLHHCIEALLEDDRVSAIGLHMEGVTDTAAFGRAAAKALERRVPVVAVKTGRSELGRRLTLSHTSTFAGEDRLYDALFRRHGMTRVASLPAFLETLKLLGATGPLPGRRIASISCSGGEASLIADKAAELGLEFASLTEEQTEILQDVLGPLVSVGNPLDYHTFIWGDGAAQARCFGTMMAGDQDITVKVFDYPQPEACDAGASDWVATVDALKTAVKRARAPVVVVSTMQENMPMAVQRELAVASMIPMLGVDECMTAIRAAVDLGEAVAKRPSAPPIAASPLPTGRRTLDEWESKQLLSSYGLPVPAGTLTTPDDAPAAARALGFPVVAKIVDAGLVHKTDAGGVHLGLDSEAAVAKAARGLTRLGTRLLIERMAGEPVVELMVGISHDAQFGPVMVVGAGGTLVELWRDTRTLLLPVDEVAVRGALSALKIGALLDGYRGGPRADVDAAVAAIMSVAAYAQAHADRLAELDVNPLLVFADGEGVLAVDAFIRLSEETNP